MRAVACQALWVSITGIVTALALTGCKETKISEAYPAIASEDRNPAMANPVVAAAGDIACEPLQWRASAESSDRQNCQMAATAALIQDLNPTAVLALGDLQYDRGEFANFQLSYAPTWGLFKAITRPAVGNHEYGTFNAAGYFRYFGAAAGDPRKGYYSFDLGNWHIIALNSNCGEIGGCRTGSPQERWLVADLAAHPTTCTLAYWHHPRFSSGPHGNSADPHPFWQALYAAGVDVVLNAHDHTYERFAPQTPDGQADPDRGIRQFVVGTGGRSLYPFETVRANSQVRNDQTYGVLALTLEPDGYEWAFVPVAGKTFTDSGRDRCH
jgi:acid phosphatase type 7